MYFYKNIFNHYIMVCGITCTIAIVFLIANLYVTFTIDKTRMKDKFYKTLSKEDIARYENIIKERRDIYLQGYGLGLVFSVIYLLLNNYFMKGMNINMTMKSLYNTGVICIVGGITVLTNYFYYILAPKSDSMIIHLNKEEQRVEWMKINKKMTVKYHVGLLLGIVAAMIFARSTLCK